MIYACPRCNGQFQATPGATVQCPHCQGEVRIPGAALAGTALDRESRGLWLESFFNVIKESISNPVAFCEEVAAGQGWVRPYLFALVVSTIAFLVAAAYQAGFQWLAAGASLGVGTMAHALVLPFSTGAILTFGIFAVPVGTTIALLIQALVYHLCLMLLGAARRDFLATFRITCYAAAPQVFQVVPVIGGLFAWAWQLTLVIIGLKVTHETSYGRSAVAVFLPMLLCCGLLILVGSTVAGWIFAAALSAAH